MDHHHHKHDQVQHKYDTEVRHNSHVERYVIFQPTTKREDYRNIRSNDVMKTDTFKWGAEYLQIISAIRNPPIAYEAIVLFVYRNHSNDNNQRDSCKNTSWN